MTSTKEKIQKEKNNISKFEEQITVLRKKIKKSNENITSYQAQWFNEATKGLSFEEIEKKLTSEE